MPALIITLTLNPALDLATTADHVAPTHKLRCGPVRRFAGGGGINVARVLHRLGADVCAWALAGGAAGTQVQQLLADEGVPTRLQRIAGDTRENFSVVETTTGQEFRFVLPGPTLQASEWQACRDALATHTPPPRWLIASGSLPPGTPDDFYAQLVRAVSAVSSQCVRVAVGTSGPPLAAALQAGVALVKPSLRELRDLLQQPLEHGLQQLRRARNAAVPQHLQQFDERHGVGAVLHQFRRGIRVGGMQPVEYIHRQGHRTSVVVIVARRCRQGGAAGTPDAPHAAQGRADRNQ